MSTRMIQNHVRVSCYDIGGAVHALYRYGRLVPDLKNQCDALLLT